MKFAAAIAFLSFALCSATVAQGVSFDWATVGNPGNAADDTGFGAVDYTYRISKHEVTYSQYTEFLNAVAATDANGLYDSLQEASTLGGIVRSGTSGSYTYAVKADAIGEGPGGADGDDHTYANKPLAFVSFLDAMRFVNWLENGQPKGMQGPKSTEDGVYAISDGGSEVRDVNATYYIPSQDEWYKSAYYDPSGVYYDYPTSSNDVPNNNLPSTDTGNSANFYDFDSGGFTTGNPYYLQTDVGSYSLSASPYETYDQGGNVWEWNEAVFDFPFRGIRGGDQSDYMRSDVLFSFNSANGSGRIGFRVASKAIPEPTTCGLAMIVTLCFVANKRESFRAIHRSAH